MDPSDSFVLKHEESDEDQRIIEFQSIAKEEMNNILENLNKTFEELMVKLDKALAMNTTTQNFARTAAYSIEKKNEDLSLYNRNVLPTAIIQSFKVEILNSLVNQLENDIKDVLSRFSYYFQDLLKLKQERNNREEERSKKLTVHLKNCVVGFIALEDSIAKTIKKKEKKLNEFYSVSSENLEITEIKPVIKNSFIELKNEIDTLLNAKKYEQAILRVLEHGKINLVVCVLSIMNPKPLIGYNLISSITALSLFKFLLDNIENCHEFSEIYLWFEELSQMISVTEIKILLPKIFDASYTYFKLTSLAKTCSKRIE